MRTQGSIDIYYFVVALDGSGDFTDIQSAINAVPDGKLGDILVKKGVYVLNPVQKWPSNQIVVKPRLTLRGEGIDKTIIQMAPTPEISVSVRSDVVTATRSVSDFRLKDLTIDQNAPAPDNNGSSAIYFRAGTTHTNILVQRVKVTNAFGAGIGFRDFNGVTVEDCQVNNAWTGISIQGGSNATIRRNRITNIKGNGIFPEVLQSQGKVVTDVIMEDNYLENIGDTGIGIASLSGLPLMERMTVRRNTIKTPDGVGIGITGGKDIDVVGNTVETLTDLAIYADVAQGTSANIRVEQNEIRTSYEVGIGFYSVWNSRAVGNNITMLTPASGVVQSGIVALIHGTGLIEGNTITGSANYGIDFAGWALGSGSNITIRGNTILDFNDIGIYDNSVSQGHILIENNTIWDRRTPFVSSYGIRTDDTSNVWTIRYNNIYAGSISFVSAPSSKVYSNIYGPPQ